MVRFISQEVGIVPEPFKNFFNVAGVKLVAKHLVQHHPALNTAEFVRDASANFASQELKERSNAIRNAMVLHLPDSFPELSKILVQSLASDTCEAESFGPGSDGIHGWYVQPMADAIAVKGLDDFDRAFPALAEMTKRFTAEFAVRPFLDQDPQRAMAWMARFARDPNFHVRRLASEGCRPRLPWGMRLRAFVADPSPILPILTALRDDPEEYVRRSVANNLNDIAKDHPDLVVEIAAEWMTGADRDRQRLVRHACRSLIKAGHVGALKALGYGKARVRVDNLAVHTPNVILGSALEFGFDVVSQAKTSQPLVVDYIIHHKKADGTLSPKVFKLKIMDLPGGQTVHVKKRHPIRPITTRVYYPGHHKVEIVVNGTTLGCSNFQLEFPAG